MSRPSLAEAVIASCDRIIERQAVFEGVDFHALKLAAERQLIDYGRASSLAKDIKHLGVEMAHVYAFIGDDSLTVKMREFETAVDALVDLQQEVCESGAPSSNTHTQLMNDMLHLIYERHPIAQKFYERCDEFSDERDAARKALCKYDSMLARELIRFAADWTAAVGKLNEPQMPGLAMLPKQATEAMANVNPAMLHPRMAKAIYARMVQVALTAKMVQGGAAEDSQPQDVGSAGCTPAVPFHFLGGGL